MGGRFGCAILAVFSLGLGMLGLEIRAAAGDELAMESISAELVAMSTRLETMEAQMQTVLAKGDAGDCCPSACCDCGWYVGAGGYFLAPSWTTNPAFATSVASGGVTNTTQTDFNYDLSVAPLLWIGYRGPNCLGFEARAWWLDESESIELTNAGGGIAINSAAPLGLRNTSTTAGDELTFDSSLEMDVLDLLGTYQSQMGIVTVDLGAGIRYARIEQQYHHTEDPAASALIDAIDSTSSFEGLGPTLALGGRFAATGRLTLLADLRYSILFGDFDQRATSTSDNVLVATRTYTTDDFLQVAEVELGAQYLLPRDCWDFFFDAAFVAQVWQGTGNSANNEIITVLVDPEVSDKDADLALIGFRLAGGVRF
jgi:hypothetical protein